MDNTVDFIDQASFLGLRALGHQPIIQFTWIYDRDVDIEGLRRFHRNLGRGLLGRRIERSPLGFGRHRWVNWRGLDDIEIAAPRPRSEIVAWMDERGFTPIDPEHGPSFRLGVLPLSDGGAAVSLTMSHTVADGVGALIAITDAVNGVDRRLGYPESGTRTKSQAWLEDSRAAMRGIPEAGKALVAAAKLARSRSDVVSASARKTKNPAGGPERVVTPPTLTVYLDATQWDERAAALGGTGTTLFIAFTARLGWRLGWLTDAGTVDVSVPVNERVDGDTRGNALTAVTMTVDPATVIDNLAGLRADLKAALSTLGEARNELLTPLPMVPLVPRALARRLEGMVISKGVIGSSNLGEFDATVNRPDGTDADYVCVRMAERLTTADLHRSGGFFFPVVSGRVHGKVFISVGFTDARAATTRAQLEAVVGETLAELGLSAEII